MTVLGEGWHEGPGTDHAEVMALRAAGAAHRGATVVVHPGAVRPVRPHTAMHARADRRRRRARRRRGHRPAPRRGTPGSAPSCAPPGSRSIAGVREEPARRLNAAFERHVRTGRPFVIWKTASSLDGKTAAADGTRRWITSPEARADAHRLRAWADAIVVGSRTALADDPALTVRDVPASIEARPPMRVLVDSAGPGAASAARSPTAPRPTIVATTERMPDARADGWTSAGVDVAVLPARRGGRRRRWAPWWTTWASGTCKGCCSRAAPRWRGRSSATTSSTAWSPTSRPRWSAAPPRPGILAGGGFAPIDTRAALRVHRRDARGPRHPGGGRCSPGSLRNAGPSGPSREPARRRRAASSRSDSPRRRLRRRERHVPHRRRARGRPPRRSTSRTRPWTARRSARVRPGDPVNLERPVTLAARLGGHLVQGHVDGARRRSSRTTPRATADRASRCGSRRRLRRYTVEKGSITVDGVSLTIASSHDDGVSIALIPHTRDVTTLGALVPGDEVDPRGRRRSPVHRTPPHGRDDPMTETTDSAIDRAPFAAIEDALEDLRAGPDGPRRGRRRPRERGRLHHRRGALHHARR